MSLSSEQLTKIHVKVEQRSVLQDPLEHEHVAVHSVPPSRSNTSMSISKDRRRGSISISRFGQVSDSQPTSPALTPIAAHSPFYKAQAANMSDASFASGASDLSDEHAHTEDHTQITQVQQIAGKQSFTKAVNHILPRRLSRSRSNNVLIPPTELLIGVSVQESRTESPASETLQLGTTVTVSAPGSQLNKNSRRSSTANKKWLTKAKSYMQNLGHKARQASIPT